MTDDRWGSPAGPGEQPWPPGSGPGPQPQAWGNPAGEILSSPVPPATAGAAPAEGLDLGLDRGPWAAEGPGVVLPGQPRRRRRRGLLLGVGALVAATVTAGAGLAYVAVGGGGDQPEQHLPGTAIAFAKVDLDPDVSQKVDAVRFLMRLPKVKDQVDEKTDLRQWVFERLVEGSPTPVTWAEVEPWLGDRAGIAVLPGTDGAAPHPVMALQVKDEKKAAATLKKLSADSGAVVRDGWAILAETDAEARSAADAAATSPLSEATPFAGDLEALGQDGVATLWVDGKRLGSALEAVAPMGGAASVERLGRSGGHGAVALRFDGPRLELAGRFAGLTAGQGLLTGETGMSTLPDDTLIAVGLSGVGQQFAAVWDEELKAAGRSTGSSPEQIAAEVEQNLGLRLPGDVSALLGDRLVLAVAGPDPNGDPSLGVRGHGDGYAEPLDRLVAALDEQGLPVERRETSGGDWVLASTAAEADALSAGGSLARSDRFRAVMPRQGGQQPLVFADLEGLARAYRDSGDGMSAQDVETLQALGAVGISVGFSGTTMSFTARIGRP